MFQTMRFNYILLSIILIFSGCKKSEIDQLPVDNGSADTVISDVIVKNYIERSYRLALGREPDSSEYAAAIPLLISTNLDSISRVSFIDSIFQSKDFRKHVYEESRIKFLDGADTAEFSNWIYIFQLFLNDTSHQNQWPYFQYEYDRMITMRDAYSAYMNDSLQVEELQRRMCDNYIYDMKHTGTANFVLSTFMNLINRNPTASEQQSAITMVNGNNAVLFQQQGSDKTDYLKIFIHSSEYYEGQIVLIYLKYLNRVPGSDELVNGALKYFSTKDYSAVQRDILISDEFIGI